ncbi:MAG: hypothetical protein P8144_01580, partial [Gammaproteobacteria bacterium]
MGSVNPPFLVTKTEHFEYKSITPPAKDGVQVWQRINTSDQSASPKTYAFVNMSEAPKSGARISMGVFDEAQEARLKVRVQLQEHRQRLTVEHNGNKQELIVPKKSDSVFEKYKGKVTEIELQFNKTDGGSGDVQWSLKESSGEKSIDHNAGDCVKAEKVEGLIQKTGPLKQAADTNRELELGRGAATEFKEDVFTLDEVSVESIENIVNSLKEGKFPIDEEKKILYKKLEEIANENNGALKKIKILKVNPAWLNKLMSPELKIKKDEPFNCRTTFLYAEGVYFSDRSSGDDNPYKVHVDFANKCLGGGWKNDRSIAQEEVAFLENEGLTSVAKYCEEREIYLRPVADSEPAVNKEHNPNPLLIEGARRIASFNTETKSLKPTNHKETVNWLAMAAPDLR